jgi:hypothetical protein
MSSWWSLGEGYGQLGDKLQTYQITCAFCSEKGNWELKHRETKKKPNGRKVINFDTYECGNCSGYVMVMWSASEHSSPATGLYNYKVLPWPLGVGDGSENWPKTVRKYWKQAHDSQNSENYDAASVMARSALQAVMRQQKAVGKDLYHEIEDLAQKGVLPNVIKEWSHEVRQLAKPSAHPDEDDEDVNSNDVEDVINFLDFLLEYVYDVPKRIENYRSRDEQEENTDE